MRIAIVGPEESKWKSEKQIMEARLYIGRIIFGKYCHFGDSFFSEKAILVSGHCPKGGVDIWAEEIADELGIKKEIYPAKVNKWNDERRCCSSSYCEQWERFPIFCGQCTLKIKDKGFRSRNIQIAEACDVLYCIVPFRDYPLASHSGIEASLTPFYKDSKCKHCDKWGHPTNGGCWTMQYAKKLGKETHLVVI